MRTTHFSWNSKAILLIFFLVLTLLSKQIKGDGRIRDEVVGSKPLRLERVPLIDKLSTSDIDSLREGLKVSADPKCIEALQDTIIKFLKGIRESNGIRIPRQDDGDGDDGDDGDGGGGGAGGGLLGAGGAGGFLGDVNLPPVVPQVLGALTDAFTGLNQVVNATSGQTSLPGFLFSSFSNLVGQFTGNTPAPVTPPTYYPVPPGAPGGYPNRWPSGGSAQLRPPQLPIAPLPPQQQQQQQQGGFPLPPVTPRAPPNPVRRSPKPKPKPVRSEPPKSSLWNIYKSFVSQTGNSQASLTDFQLAHPEGFHNELLQSISSSLSKNRGPVSSTERNSNLGFVDISSNSNGNGGGGGFGSSSSGQFTNSPSFTFNNPGQTNNNKSPQQQVSSSNAGNTEDTDSTAGDISAPPPVNRPPVQFVTPPSPPKLVYNPEPSIKPSALIQQIIPGRITLPPELIPESTPAAPATAESDTLSSSPHHHQSFPEANDIKEPNHHQPLPQLSLLNRPEIKPEDEQLQISTEIAHETGTLLPITDPIIVISKSPASRLPPPATKLTIPTTPKPVLEQTEDYYDPDDFYNHPSTAIYNLQPVIVAQPTPSPSLNLFDNSNRRTSPPRTLPPTRDWSIPKIRTTTEEPPTVEEEGGGLVTELSISAPNRLTNWITGNTNSPGGSSPAKGSRPVIINNILYPDLETARNATKSTEKPPPPLRRRRKTTTTTPPPAQDSDYYEDEDGVVGKAGKKKASRNYSDRELLQVSHEILL